MKFADWYSSHIYPVWVNTIGRVMGIFPFSVVEILLYVVIVVLAVTLIRSILLTYKKEKGALLRWGRGVLILATVLFLLYILNCGINYKKQSFAESSGIGTTEYTAEDLQQVCEWLTGQVNDWSGKVMRDKDGVMVVSKKNRTGNVPEDAVTAMQNLGKEYPELSGFYPRPKPLIESWILSVQNLTGVYSPFTVEANYNNAMTDYNKPFTACHELSHLKGFMQEQEANFIAFLACRESEEAEFQYSGNLMGWIYCMNVLHDVDYEAWEQVRSGLNSEVEADLQANSEFWNKYDGTVAEVSNKVNDTYLKANGQSDGVKSYDRMVDLVVTWWKETYN